MELANGECIKNSTEAKGSATVEIRDEEGNLRTATLTNVLYAPTFPFNIFSVKSATKNGSIVILGAESGYLRYKDGTNFPIHSKDDLYFLNINTPASNDNRSTRRDTLYFARFGTFDTTTFDNTTDLDTSSSQGSSQSSSKSSMKSR